METQVMLCAGRLPYPYRLLIPPLRLSSLKRTGAPPIPQAISTPPNTPTATEQFETNTLYFFRVHTGASPPRPHCDEAEEIKSDKISAPAHQNIATNRKHCFTHLTNLLCGHFYFFIIVDCIITVIKQYPALPRSRKDLPR